MASRFDFQSPVNYLGRVYGRLTVVSETSPIKLQSGKRNRRVKCLCVCGTIKVIQVSSLISGRTHSCGCLRSEVAGRNIKALNTTHGKTGTSLYKTWDSLKQRCLNTNDKDYLNYGGRGITVYIPWINNFVAFASYVDKCLGPRPRNHSLDRIDNNLGYMPGNLRWATASDQRKNQRNKMNSNQYTAQEVTCGR